MHVTIGMIVLNEEQFLAANLRQHYPFADEIIIVEGADRRYPKERVTADGLSTDRTAEIVRSFPDPDHKIQFLQYGWADDKAVLRDQYAQLAYEGILLAVDADEFLTHDSMRGLLGMLIEKLPGPGCVRIPHVHFWKDDRHVISGGYYDVPHNRAYRWPAGARYLREHNHPELDGKYLYQLHLEKHGRKAVYEPERVTFQEPFWIHYGFMKSAENIRDKNQFYINRGEAVTRPQTTRDRAYWFRDDGLPQDCDLMEWRGPWPEEMPCSAPPS